MRTPGPWSYEHDEDKPFTPEQIFAGKKLIAQVIGDSAETEANAHFIVAACNLHDELVAALKSARRCLSEHLHAVVNLTTGESIGQRIDKTLAKATQEAPDETA